MMPVSLRLRTDQNTRVTYEEELHTAQAQFCIQTDLSTMATGKMDARKDSESFIFLMGLGKVNPINSLFGIGTKASGRLENTTDRAYMRRRAERATKANGLTGDITDSESSSGPTEASTKAIGKTAKRTEKEHLGEKTGQFTKANGLTESTMDKEGFNYLTEKFKKVSLQRAASFSENRK